MLSLRLGFLFWILSAVPWEGTSNSSSFELSASPPAPAEEKLASWRVLIVWGKGVTVSATAVPEEYCLPASCGPGDAAVRPQASGDLHGEVRAPKGEGRRGGPSGQPGASPCRGCWGCISWKPDLGRSPAVCVDLFDGCCACMPGFRT